MRAFIFLVLLSISNLLSAQLPQKVSDVGDVFNWQVVTLQNHIVYTAFEGSVTYSKLYSTQGNIANTNQICDSVTFLSNRVFREKSVFVRKSDELWISDGTKLNTKMIFKLPKLFQFTREFIISNDYLYFKTNDSINGKEFWVTYGSGNANSTKMLGPFFSESVWLGYAVGFNQGVLLWVDLKYDSTDLFFFNKDSQKPVNLTGKFPRWSSGYPNSNLNIPLAFKTKAYFGFNHRTYGLELFETDGTADGTKVIDISPGLDDSHPNDAFIEYGKLFVCAGTRPGISRNVITIDDGGIENILPFQT